MERTPGRGTCAERAPAAVKIIAKKGPEGFYTGEIAEKIVKSLNKMGGVHSLIDFEEVNGEFVEPINAKYKNMLQFNDNLICIIFRK